MRFTGRFALLVATIFAATIVVAPFFKLGIDALLRDSPTAADLLHMELADGHYDFGRAYRRLFMLVALVAILVGRRWLGSVSMLGVRRGESRARMLGLGALVGVLSWTMFLVLLLLLGYRGLDPSPPADWIMIAAVAVFAALIVGLVEELALRGYVLGGLLQDWPRIVAVLGSSALYSVLHFMKNKVSSGLGWDPAVGAQAFAAHITPLSHPAVLLPFVGLSLVGVVLAYAYLWTRSLPFVIGLHAGWIFLARIDGFLLEHRGGMGGLYGEHGILASPVCWGFLLLVLLLLRVAAPRVAPARMDG